MKKLRERLRIYGSQTLLTEELLAIVLSTGYNRQGKDTLELARKLLAAYKGLGGQLRVDYQELVRESGLVHFHQR